MDDADMTSLWDELGVSADEVVPPMPEDLWDTTIAAVVDPDTTPLDSDLVPYSDDAATDAYVDVDVDVDDAGFPVSGPDDRSHDDAGSFDDSGYDVHDADDSWGNADPGDIDLGADGF